jgi:hypothetical protein
MTLGALGHLNFRTFLQLNHKQDQWDDMECRNQAEECVIRHAPEWMSDLKAAWVENLRANPRPEPADVVARMRERVMDELRALFENFLVQGSPEDHRLMVDVLEGVQDSGSRNANHAVTLGEEFNRELGLDRGYVTVPGRLRREVEVYIEDLKAGKYKKPVLKTLAGGGCSVAEEEDDD